MRDNHQAGPTFSCRPRWFRTTVAFGFLLVLFLGTGHAAQPSAYSKEYEITVDPTELAPPTRWHVPGVTPIIATMDPEYTDAYSTTERRVVKLKPGRYHFGTFTFDFPFQVTLEGTLDYSSSLDQCVKGRGTKTLTIQCSRTQPYSGRPDY